MAKSLTTLKLSRGHARYKFGKLDNLLVLGIKEEEHFQPKGIIENSKEGISGLLDFDVILQFDSVEMIDNIIETLEKLKNKFGH